MGEEAWLEVETAEYGCARVSTGMDSHGLGIDLKVATEVYSVHSDFTDGKSCNYCPLVIEF